MFDPATQPSQSTCCFTIITCLSWFCSIKKEKITPISSSQLSCVDRVYLQTNPNVQKLANEYGIKNNIYEIELVRLL